jgi:L-ribulose-5-phosphate 4-epimerase
MLEELKKRVCEANLKLVAEGLVILTWGNASGIDRATGHVVIKPSGVPYDQMRPEHMAVVSLESGRLVEGDKKPSVDTPIHIELYRAFETVGGVVHTHSLHATAWAQSRRELPALGTTHADYFYGPVPCTRLLEPKEIARDYEANIGRTIVEAMEFLDPAQYPAALVADHGPFTWGPTPQSAVECAVVLEYLARLASETAYIEPYPRQRQRALIEKHFLRKHGPGAYYGQE